jgi:hypothetical protein
MWRGNGLGRACDIVDRKLLHSVRPSLSCKTVVWVVCGTARILRQAKRDRKECATTVGRRKSSADRKECATTVGRRESSASPRSKKCATKPCMQDTLASRYGDVTVSPGPGTSIRGTTTYTYMMPPCPCGTTSTQTKCVEINEIAYIT